MNYLIRNYTKSDLQYLYGICLKTGDSGKDASGIYKNPSLLGDYYAAPYAEIHPELTFILEKDSLPIGYILGTNNSIEFREKTEKIWFPALREKYPYPDDINKSKDSEIIRLIHKGYIPKKELVSFPAHLHIDILPEGQGIGMGKKLVFTFIDKLKEQKTPALHLEVGKTNKGAIKFYEKAGFKIIFEYEYSIAFGMEL